MDAPKVLLWKRDELLGRARGETFFATQAHVDLALTEAALPRIQTKQGKHGALDDAFTRQATKLLMTAVGTGTHKTPRGLAMQAEDQSNQMAGYPIYGC